VSIDEEAYLWANTAALYGGAPDFVRPTACWVVLEAVGPDRLQVIAAVRVRLGYAPQAAKEAVDAVPTTFGPFEPVLGADPLVRALRAVGAIVSVRLVT